MMVIWRKGAPDNRACRGKVNGELVRDSGMLDIGDALRSEQTCKDLTVLAGLARSKRSKRPNRQAKVEANAVDVAGADAGTGQDEQTVLRQKRPQLVHER